MNEKKRGGPRPNSGRKTKPEHEKSLKKMVVFTPEHWALVKDAPTRIVREALNAYFKSEDALNTTSPVEVETGKEYLINYHVHENGVFTKIVKVKPTE